MVELETKEFEGRIDTKHTGGSILLVFQYVPKSTSNDESGSIIWGRRTMFPVSISVEK